MSLSDRLIASIRAYEATYNSNSRACQLLRDAADELDRLRTEVARQWQPIETAPLDVKWLLTWDGSHYHIATRLGWTGMKPTHWMPLPAPPGKEER